MLWNVCVFLASLFSVSETPTMTSSVLATVFLLLPVFLLVRHTYKIAGKIDVSPLVFAVINAAGSLLLTLLVTILNETTTQFFSHPSVYLTYLGVGLGSYFGVKSAKLIIKEG